MHARAWKSASDMTVQVARSLYEGTILRVMRVTMPSMPRLGKTHSSNLSSYRDRIGECVWWWAYVH